MILYTHRHFPTQRERERERDKGVMTKKLHQSIENQREISFRPLDDRNDDRLDDRFILLRLLVVNFIFRVEKNLPCLG